MKPSKYSSQVRIEVGVMRLLNPHGVIEMNWQQDPDVLEVLKLHQSEALNLLKSIVNIRYSRR